LGRKKPPYLYPPAGVTICGMEINPRLYDSEPMMRCRLHQCRAACCLYGVWVDLKEQQDILAQGSLISPFMRQGYADPQTWFNDEEDTDEFSPSQQVRHTTVLEDKAHYGSTSCVFLRPDHKCALQVAADANGLHSWRFKPFYCILHPLDLDEQGRISLDETELLLDEPGSCLRPANTLIPLAETFEQELVHFLGAETQKRILEEARMRLKLK
jgi:hypothetical protein